MNEQRIADRVARDPTARTRKHDLVRLLKSEGVRIRSIDEEPMGKTIEFPSKDDAWIGYNILREEGFSPEIVSKYHVMVAKEMTAVASIKASRRRKATWGFSVPAKPVGAKGGQLTDVKADWRKVARGLKDGNVDVDIASVIKRVAERNSIALSRGETVHAEKTFRIDLRLNLNPNDPIELEIQVD